MSLSRFTVPAALLVALTVPAIAAAQTGGQKPQSAPPAMPMPKPGPEQELLKMDVGTWDATVEMAGDPSGKPMTSKGVEVNTLGCGGLCLITDFKATMMGAPFHGHGTTTWDATKKKYAGSWVDAMTQGLGVSEGSWDAAAKKFTGTMEMPDQTGKVVKTRTVVEYPSSSKRVMTMFAPGPDGKEIQALKISYTRRK